MCNALNKNRSVRVERRDEVMWASLELKAAARTGEPRSGHNIVARFHPQGNYVGVRYHLRPNMHVKFFFFKLCNFIDFLFYNKICTIYNSIYGKINF